MRTWSLLSCLLVAAAFGCRAPADPFQGDAGRWVDLTYSFSEETVNWPTAEPFRLEQVAYGRTEAGYFYAANNLSVSEHCGTHFDAPIHFAEDGLTNEQVPLERLIGPAVVVDVSERVSPDYLIQVSDFELWEERHGPIPDGAIVLLRTGWGQRWPDRQSYLGTELLGPEAIPELHFPGLAPEAGRWLVEERRIDALGLDTPSIDYGQSSTFETHQILFAAGIPAFENVAHLDELPEAGSYVVALPMKVAGGSGGPLRIVAFIPRR